jgi:exopolyphosphatase/guanosine-5'-triphosphate,3'-diphosphate pyrophosphatase
MTADRRQADAKGRILAHRFAPSDTTGMRLAAIDIGTNSVHMIVVQVRPDLSFEVIDREKEMVRLGAGGLDGRALTDAAMNASLQALSKFRRLADSHGVDEIIAAATSATREAENGGDFLNAIREQTGIAVRVISGVEEARLIHMAAGYGVDLGGKRGVVIDIGGGSVEITLGPSREAELAKSFKIGVIRLTERFVRTDPLSGRDERRLVKYINQEIGAHVDHIVAKGYQRVIGTSGTILSLGGMARAAEADALSDEVRNRRVAARTLHRMRKQLVDSDLQERLQIPGLDPRRADLAVGGAVLLDTILRRLGAEELTLCDLALREGLILDYARRNRKHIAAIDRYPDIRRRSVEELGERCHYWSEHARQVAHLALTLFDQTATIHGLSSREREWLEFGALLHDVGVHISYTSHHKHSYYLIRHGDLRGFEPEEIEVIALIARYHRQATPKKSHEGYGALRPQLRRTVRTLAAFVRLAEGLDRSHAQVVGRIDVQDRGEDLLMRARASGDAELEQWAAQRYLKPLERALDRVVRFELEARLPRPVATPAAAVPANVGQPRRPRARRTRRAGS